MDDAMPPLVSAPQALPIRSEPCKPVELSTQVSILEEGELDERRLLVAYSSSPPPLIEDRSGLLECDSPASMKQANVQTLRDELELSTYEYAALEERYSTLSGQHRELRKLASAYADVIRGSPRYDADTTSVEQLRADAGTEGLRAKALEADHLRPMFRAAGGVQAFLTRNRVLQSLVDEAGGLQELTKQVGTARTLRQQLEEVGGLQGLSHLVSEVHILRSKQHEHAELRANVDGPDGLRSKALKYDMLQQAFAAIQRGPIDQPTHTSHTFPMSEPIKRTRMDTPAQVGTPAPGVGPIVNPARAHLLSTAPSDRDPDRDLYAPPPPPPQPSKKTGSNDVPLGGKRRRGMGASSDVGSGGGDPKRLKYENVPQPSIQPTRTRRKVDVGRASAMVQANLQPRSTAPWSGAAPAWAGGGASWQVRFDAMLGSSSTSSPAPSDGRLLKEESPVSSF